MNLLFKIWLCDKSKALTIYCSIKLQKKLKVFNYHFNFLVERSGNFDNNVEDVNEAEHDANEVNDVNSMTKH